MSINFDPVTLAFPVDRPKSIEYAALQFLESTQSRSPEHFKFATGITMNLRGLKDSEITDALSSLKEKGYIESPPTMENRAYYITAHGQTYLANLEREIEARNKGRAQRVEAQPAASKKTIVPRVSVAAKAAIQKSPMPVVVTPVLAPAVLPPQPEQPKAMVAKELPAIPYVGTRAFPEDTGKRAQIGILKMLKLKTGQNPMHANEITITLAAPKVPAEKLGLADGTESVSNPFRSDYDTVVRELERLVADHRIKLFEDAANPNFKAYSIEDSGKDLLSDLEGEWRRAMQNQQTAGSSVPPSSDWKQFVQTPAASAIGLKA